MYLLCSWGQWLCNPSVVVAYNGNRYSSWPSGSRQCSNVYHWREQPESRSVCSLEKIWYFKQSLNNHGIILYYDTYLLSLSYCLYISDLLVISIYIRRLHYLCRIVIVFLHFATIFHFISNQWVHEYMDNYTKFYFNFDSISLNWEHL